MLSLLVVGAYAQTTPVEADMPKVTVIKKHWSFQVRNPALDESPFIAIEERLQEEQDVRETAAENRRRASLGLRPVKAPVRPPTERMDGASSANYVYEIKVKNDSEKAISKLALVYVFLDPNTKQELGRKHFLSKQEMAAGKTRNLVFRSVSPPTGTVNANDKGKKLNELYVEQVMIESVEYKDGSKWNAAPKNQ